MAGTWQALTKQPGFNTSTMILLTDGRVMIQEEGTAHWHALAPDASGSYVNGTWSTLADMSFWRRYYASGVLKDGRVFVCGGEQSGGGDDTNQGEIYDPAADKWSPIHLPPWANVGDAACCVLPDGRILIGALLSGDCIIYDPAADSWSTTGSQPGRTNEQTWILLPDDTIVTTQCFAPFGTQKYVISSGTWKDEGALPVTLVDPAMSEIGPAMLMYNGKTIFFGAANSNGHGKTALFTMPATPTGRGTWTAGPDIPLVGGNVIVCNDCPATLLPNGKVLFTAANFVANGWGHPVLFFEYDPWSNTITQAPAPSNNDTFPYPDSPGVYFSRLMLLPTGQVLFSASSSDIQCYTPDSGPQEAWRPTIASITPHGTANHVDYYLLRGTQLNGLSQANIYGDDVYPATNYPLVQLTDVMTERVYYCQTYEFSTMGVATGAAIQSARFRVGNVPDGTYDLRVIANGISSHAVTFAYARGGEASPSAGTGFLNGEPEADPEIVALQAQLKFLRNSIDRLASLTKSGPVDPRQVAKKAGDDEAKGKKTRKPPAVER